jgi:RNA polymerase sigma factor (sigma-70 family)
MVWLRSTAMDTDPKNIGSQLPPERGPDAGRLGLEGLARRYYGPLMSFFRKRARHSADAQDLVQQVFLKLSQYSDIDNIRNAEGYIFQTAANTLRDHIRDAAVSNRFLNKKRIEIAEESGSGFSPERVLLARESVALLAEALRQLPERTRDVLMLRCFEGLKHAEIARLQGISIRMVEKHMERALAHLSAAIEYRAGK